MEEMNRKRSEAEAKKAAYQEWLKQNELDSTGDAAYDGITVTDMGVSRTQAWVRTLDDGPDPPQGRDSSTAENPAKPYLTHPSGWGTSFVAHSVCVFVALDCVQWSTIGRRSSSSPTSPILRRGRACDRAWRMGS